MKRLLVETVCLLMLCSSATLADFKFKGKKNIVYADQSAFDAEEIDFEAYGDAMPLNIALEVLVGDQISVAYGSDIDQNTIISWRGGRARAEVLSEIFAPIGLQYRYANNTLSVFSENEIAAAKRLGVQIIDGVPTEPVLWRIEAPTTVKAVFTEWTELAGKQLAWKLADQDNCAITVSHTLEGSFADAARQVVLLSNKHGNCSIPYGHLTGNGVLVIDQLYRGQK